MQPADEVEQFSVPAGFRQRRVPHVKIEIDVIVRLPVKGAEPPERTVRYTVTKRLT